MRMPEHWEMMPKFMVAAAIATFFIFIMSYLLKNSSMYDPFWSVQPMVFGAGLVAAYGIENVTTHQWITVIGMQLYGLASPPISIATGLDYPTRIGVIRI